MNCRIIFCFLETYSVVYYSNTITAALCNSHNPADTCYKPAAWCGLVAVVCYIMFD